jgi:tight adherence protein C
MNEWLQLSGISLAVAAVSFLVLRGLLAVTRRPEPAEDDEGGERKLVLGEWTPAFAAQMPVDYDHEPELRKELFAAGFYRPSALTEYAAVRAVLVLLALAATGVWAYLAPASQLTWILLSGGALAVLGYSLPRVYLAAKARQRRRQIERGLPIAIDIMTLCLSAGQTILAGLQQAARELRSSHPAVADELAIAERQASLHTLETALQHWADRVHVPEVRNLALLLIQSERLGTDTAATLLEYASSLRTGMRQRADASAGRASFWMLFPSVFCLFVAAAIILVGPTYLEFWNHRRQSVDLVRQGRLTVEGTGQPGGANRAAAPAPGAAAAVVPPTSLSRQLQPNPAARPRTPTPASPSSVGF